MGDLKKRASFARVVNYVNNPKKARLIDSKDVRQDDNTTIARSMQGQADDKPGRKLKNPVYHISLDFAHEDTPRLTDDLMVEIAREYMRRMGITNTQYIVCRHTDREHQHLHIVANRVDNDGNTISDSNDNVRNVKVCKTLTREYGLHFSKGKMNVKRDRLRGKDKVKYQIYDAVKAALPHCNCWSDLCDRLAKQGIGVNFKYNRNEGKIIGVSFTKNEISFSGSRIDRSMSFYKLDRFFGNQIAEGMEWRPRVQEQPQPIRQDVESHNNTTDTFIREPSPIDCLYSSMASLLPKMALTFSGALPLKNCITGSSFASSLFNASFLSGLSFASSFFLTSSMSTANAPIRSVKFCLLSFIFFSFLVYVCPFRCHSHPSRFRFLHLRRRMTPWLGVAARTTP